MSHEPRRAPLSLFALLALAMAGGCSDSSGPEEPEDRGVLISAAGFASGQGDPVWTSTGSQLAYISLGDEGVNAVNAVTVAAPNTVRQFHASSATVPLALSGAGSHIYFGLAVTSGGLNDANFLIMRVEPAAGSPELLITTFQSSRDYVVVSEDERFLVTRSRLYDLQAGGAIDLPGGTPVGFSSDGTQLLYNVDQTSSSVPLPTLIATADGSARPLHPTGTFYHGHRWQGNSPQLLRVSNNHQGTVSVSEVDGMTGATRDLAEFAISHTGYGFESGNWSRDGGALAVWIDEGRLTRLYVIRAGSAPAPVASVTGSVSRPVFSPNGSSIAYFLYLGLGQRRLYLKSGI